jgi:hypothetical protein
MSACPPHFFRVARPSPPAALSGAAGIRRNATTAVEPLAPSAGAAAFLFVVQSASWRRTFAFVQPHALVKEPTENQANRHFQT